MRIILLVSILSFIIACKAKEAPVASICSDNTGEPIPLKATVLDTLDLSLDSQMVLASQTPIQYNEEDSTLLVYDIYGNRIMKYQVTIQGDMIKADSIHHLKFKNRVDYFRYYNPDTLMLYVYGNSKLYYYSQNKDSVYKVITLSPEHIRRNFSFNPSPPFVGTGSPLIFKGNNIYGTGFLSGEHDDEKPEGRTICTRMDLTTGKLSYKVPYSKVYRTSNWGGSHMRMPYSAYNAGAGTLLLSLPADHNIQVITVDTALNVREVYAGTREKICITSMPVEKSDKRLNDPGNGLQYFLTTASYRNIIFDHYRNRYYRMLELPYPREVVEKKERLVKRFRLIAFDQDFKYLGEATLPTGLSKSNYFLTSRGIYFLNTNNKNENIGQYLQINLEI